MIPLWATNRPSLDLSFLGASLPSNVTSTRASSATYFDSSGVLQTALSNVARFDYDPVTHLPKGPLIEEARTNLLLRSEAFDNASWTKTHSSISADAAAAPDGNTTMDKLVEDGTTNTHAVSQAASISSGGSYAMSCYAKAGERSILWFQFGSGFFTAPIVYFNLANGTVGTKGTGLTATIEDCGGGIYRCCAYDTSNGTTASMSIGASTADNVTSYAGDGSSGLYIWGAQLEAGVCRSSYIATAGATATRSADVCNVATLTPWFNSAAGTLVVEFDAPAYNPIGTTPRGVADFYTDSSNRIGLLLNDSNPNAARFQSTDGGTAQATIDKNYTALSVSKAAAAWAANDFQVYLNGSAGTADSSGTVPSVTTLGIGNRAGDNTFIGHVRRIQYWPRRLADAQLGSLST